MPDACRTTQHCAYHGWCHRCDSRFAALMGEINRIVQTETDDSGAWGPLYTRIAEVLHGKGETAIAAELAEARATNRRLNHRAQAAASRWAQVESAVGDWQASEQGTYIPLRSLIVLAKLVGKPFDGERYVSHRQRVEELEATVDRLHHLLEHWSTLPSTPLDPSQSWWWEQRLKELAATLAGEELPGASERIRLQVWRALERAGISEVQAASRLGVSVEWVRNRLTGKVEMSVGWAERLLKLCGQSLEIGMNPAANEAGEHAKSST